MLSAGFFMGKYVICTRFSGFAGHLLGTDAINRVCTYLFTRLHNRTDVALQRLCNCDGKPDGGDVAVQRLYVFAQRPKKQKNAEI